MSVHRKLDAPAANSLLCSATAKERLRRIRLLEQLVHAVCIRASAEICETILPTSVS